MKKLLSLLLSLTAIILNLTILTACSGTEKFSKSSFDYFDTVSTVIGYAEDKEEFDEVASLIFKELEEYHRLYDIYKVYDGINNLAAVNALVNGEHKSVKVDRKIIDMLIYAKEAYNLTDGYVNVAMGSVLSLWHDYRILGIDDPSTAELPSMKALSEAAKHTAIDSIVIDEAASTVTITDPKVKIDVGAIAKGYAVEMIARMLEERNITGYLLNVGGNVRTIGARADGEVWTIGVENPLDSESGDYVAYLGFKGESLVTSGSYQRYYIVDGVKYHHIIDKDTLMPADKGYASVSIITKNSALGDALSTALFCMDRDTGLALIESLSGVEAMWVLSDGAKHYSSGFKSYEK